MAADLPDGRLVRRLITLKMLTKRGDARHPVVRKDKGEGHMGLLSVLAAAAGAWIFGSIWYGVLGKPWMATAELTPEQISHNRKNIAAFVGSFVMAVLVAGMMRHMFVSSDVTTLSKGIVTGRGLGAFIASPWIITSYLFSQRKPMLMLIVTGYVAGGCTVMGAILTLI